MLALACLQVVDTWQSYFQRTRMQNNNNQIKKTNLALIMFISFMLAWQVLNRAHFKEPEFRT